VDLLIGTYKFGYANYQQMRTDTTILTFYKLDKVEGVYQEFPNADTITRRLKKLAQVISKSDYFFENAENLSEPTGLTLEEKNRIYDLLINFGVPVNSDGKNDWAFLKSKLYGDAEQV